MIGESLEQVPNGTASSEVDKSTSVSLSSADCPTDGARINGAADLSSEDIENQTGLVCDYQVDPGVSAIPDACTAPSNVNSVNKKVDPDGTKAEYAPTPKISSKATSFSTDIKPSGKSALPFIAQGDDDDDDVTLEDGVSLNVLCGESTDGMSASTRRHQTFKRSRSPSSNAVSNPDLEAGGFIMEDETDSPEATVIRMLRGLNSADSESGQPEHRLEEGASIPPILSPPAIAMTSSNDNMTVSNSIIVEQDDGDATAADGESDAATAPETRVTFCSWCMTRLVCVPMILLLTFTTVIVIVVVVLIPGLLFLAVSIGFYYCCTRDPIPLRVLLQAMLWDTEADNASTSTGANAIRFTTNEIHAALIRRTCLAIVQRPEGGNDSPVPPSPATPLVDPAIQAAADYIFVHDHYTYYFSKPLQADPPDLASRSHDVNLGLSNEGMASLERLLDAMNDRYAAGLADTDDEDTASDRAVIQRHARPRRLGHAVSSNRAPEEEGIEMQAPSSQVSVTSGATSTGLSASLSPSLVVQTPSESEEGQHITSATQPGVDADEQPPDQRTSNVISTIAEPVDEATNETTQSFDEVWDNVSLASMRHNRMRQSTERAEGAATTAVTFPVALTASDALEQVQTAVECTETAPAEPHSATNDDNESSCTGMPNRGIACDICLLHYKVNDTLAWSHNPECSHMYHVDCITDWLQASSNRNNHSCPNCRSDFLFYEHHKKEMIKQQLLLRQRSSRGSFVVTTTTTTTAAPGTAPPVRAEVHL